MITEEQNISLPTPVGEGLGVRPQVATIGFFDGVHEGHRFVVSQVARLAKEIGGRSLVVTFRNHPASLFCPEKQPKLLTTAEEKRKKLLAAGADEVLMLDFDKSLASKTAAEFMAFLKEEHGVSHLLLGYDNRFGRTQGPPLQADNKQANKVGAGLVSARNPESFEDYVATGKTLGIEVRKLKPFLTVIKPYSSHLPTSSTLIRNLLQQGALGAANSRLGYRYSLEGEVVSGYKIGRKMGFPTANLKVTGNKLIPCSGVYAVNVSLPQKDSSPSSFSATSPTLFRAMLNIGHRPTFNGHETTIEVHILDFQGDLYGQTIRIEFLKRIRDERKFASTEELIAQLQKDRDTIVENR